MSISIYFFFMYVIFMVFVKVDEYFNPFKVVWIILVSIWFGAPHIIMIIRDYYIEYLVLDLAVNKDIPIPLWVPLSMSQSARGELFPVGPAFVYHSARGDMYTIVICDTHFIIYLLVSYYTQFLICTVLASVIVVWFL